MFMINSLVKAHSRFHLLPANGCMEKTIHRECCQYRDWQFKYDIIQNMRRLMKLLIIEDEAKLAEYLSKGLALQGLLQILPMMA
jgi:hypothetical protein